MMTFVILNQPEMSENGKKLGNSWYISPKDFKGCLLVHRLFSNFSIGNFFISYEFFKGILTYIVSENKGKWSNSQTGWRYELLKKKFLPNSKFSHPKPLCTKVKKCKRWLFNDFPWFPTTHTTIVLWYMIVEPIWVT